MRHTPLSVSLAAVLAACSCVPWSRPAPERAPEVVRTEPDRPQDEPTRVFDEATRRAELVKRFPGVDGIDLVRFVSWTDEKSGACWSEAAPPWETKIDARYRLRGARETTASSFADLKEEGWLPIYRSPSGTGLERRAAFDAVDLTVTTDYVCRCKPGQAAPEETRVPLRVHLRWQGKGKMPEVSGALVDGDGAPQGAKIVFAAGSLLTYEVPIRVPYPGGRPGSCGGSIALYVLASPPVL